MAKVRLTKNELKSQRDALARFTRYLPTLMLKKQQLQAEVRRAAAALEENRAARDKLQAEMRVWVALFSRDFDFSPWLKIDRIETGTVNLMGVNLTTLERLKFTPERPDPADTPYWVDEGLEAIKEMTRLLVEERLLARGLAALGDELRLTSQRVNLFEKVMIPRCRENIRRIRIFLGDQETAAVARAKIAKAKTRERATSA